MLTSCNSAPFKAYDPIKTVTRPSLQTGLTPFPDNILPFSDKAKTSPTITLAAILTKIVPVFSRSDGTPSDPFASPDRFLSWEDVSTLPPNALSVIAPWVYDALAQVTKPQIRPTGKTTTTKKITSTLVKPMTMASSKPKTTPSYCTPGQK
ncbi:hypothetical protein PAAG_12458 [Paracoccidioides lutzii Pb01]|uniref:Uncharacterized protein n=1 Tax=Paracoccidioides lutzii (strain ATCC MYA-826 / Pb01) TaxID=502779 RepID=A0A0A2V3Y3_PARBA|nr:hypothetical protein PAAG_12458 [Paracoccidioides lutzii Pb01]KGQ00870.1 hypothetical protein PAAG_12458 [Paracoccidioides lutzii Pb01]